MFWKKKNSNGLPDLPPMEPSAIPLPPKEELISHPPSSEKFEEKHELPPLPEPSESHEEATIKKAVLDSPTSNETENEIVNIPPSEKVFKTIELEEWTPKSNMQTQTIQQPSITQPLSMPEPKPVQQAFKPSNLPPQIKNEPPKESHSDIYVKIDKFFSVKRALSAAEEKLEEIDDLLKKIRETKLREEQELSGWEKDLLSLKTRIKEVTNILSEKA